MFTLHTYISHEKKTGLVFFGSRLAQVWIDEKIYDLAMLLTVFIYCNFMIGLEGDKGEEVTYLFNTHNE